MTQSLECQKKVQASASMYTIDQRSHTISWQIIHSMQALILVLAPKEMLGMTSPWNSLIIRMLCLSFLNAPRYWYVGAAGPSVEI